MRPGERGLDRLSIGELRLDLLSECRANGELFLVAELSQELQRRLRANHLDGAERLLRDWLTRLPDEQPAGLMASPGFALTGPTSSEVRQIDADHLDGLRKRIIW